MKTKTINPPPGSHISQVCEQACRIAVDEACNVTFDFNGIQLTATSSTTPRELSASYDMESDRRYKAYTESREYKEAQAAAELKEADRKAIVETILEDAPQEMTISDPDAWREFREKNSDGYGKAILTYAERWARIMEARMAVGENLGDIAEECSDLANEEGVTGFMYGAAVATLSKVWEHGEALRRWHNLRT